MSKAAVKYALNEEVDIVGGIYKRHRRAVYKGDSGKTMCYVEIGTGSSATTKHIRLTSIAKRREDPMTNNTTGDITIPRAEYDKMLKDMESLKLCINELDSTLQRFKR